MMADVLRHAFQSSTPSNRMGVTVVFQISGVLLASPPWGKEIYKYSNCRGGERAIRPNNLRTPSCDAIVTRFFR